MDCSVTALNKRTNQSDRKHNVQGDALKFAQIWNLHGSLNIKAGDVKLLVSKLKSLNFDIEFH